MSLRAGDDRDPGPRAAATASATAAASSPTRPMRIGVVACGYADGYPRIAPTGTPVLVDGVRTDDRGPGVDGHAHGRPERLARRPASAPRRRCGAGRRRRAAVDRRGRAVGRHRRLRADVRAGAAGADRAADAEPTMAVEMALVRRGVKSSSTRSARRAPAGRTSTRSRARSHLRFDVPRVVAARWRQGASAGAARPAHHRRRRRRDQGADEPQPGRTAPTRLRRLQDLVDGVADAAARAPGDEADARRRSGGASRARASARRSRPARGKVRRMSASSPDCAARATIRRWPRKSRSTPAPSAAASARSGSASARTCEAWNTLVESVADSGPARNRYQAARPGGGAGGRHPVGDRGQRRRPPADRSRRARPRARRRHRRRRRGADRRRPGDRQVDPAAAGARRAVAADEDALRHRRGKRRPGGAALAPPRARRRAAVRVLAEIQLEKISRRDRGRAAGGLRDRFDPDRLQRRSSRRRPARSRRCANARRS